MIEERSTGFEAGAEGASIELESLVKAELSEAGELLPIFATLGGKAVAIVPASDYCELLALRMRLPRSSLVNLRNKVRTGWAPRPQIGLSTIERDAEVTAWLRDRFHGGITIEQLHADCLATFGADRTPSPQRISRFRLKFRRGR